jgi:hypothetical protein
MPDSKSAITRVPMRHDSNVNCEERDTGETFGITDQNLRLFLPVPTEVELVPATVDICSVSDDSEEKNVKGHRSSVHVHEPRKRWESTR